MGVHARGATAEFCVAPFGGMRAYAVVRIDKG